jgi:hypothetical protein
VQQRLSDLLHARQRDASSLFYCQRMIGRLHLDEGPLAHGLSAELQTG